MSRPAEDSNSFSRIYKKTEFDYLLIKIGGWSRFQHIQWLLLFLAAVPQAWYTYAPAFAAAKPKEGQVYCAENPKIQGKAFCTAWQNGTCQEAGYNVPYSSIVTDWDILCDDAKKYVPLTKTIFYAGKLFGAYFFGWVSDRYGRRVTLLITMLVQFIASLIESFSVNFVMYVVLRVPLGICSGGCLIAGFLLMTEMATPQWRRWANCLSQVAYGVGIAVQALIAYFIRGWKEFSLVITLLNVPFILYYWLIPESPRWLSARGRVKEAEEILRKMAKTNGYEYPEGAIAGMQEKGKEEDRKKTYHLWHLFSTGYLIRITLIEAWSWCVTSMVYYGLGFNSGNLAGDFYLNFASSGLVEIPAYLLATYLVEKVNRRIPLMTYYIIGGIALICVFFIQLAGKQDEHAGLVMALALIGKFTISAAYYQIYIHTAELYPTVIRCACFYGPACPGYLDDPCQPYKLPPPPPDKFTLYYNEKQRSCSPMGCQDSYFSGRVIQSLTEHKKREDLYEKYWSSTFVLPGNGSSYAQSKVRWDNQQCTTQEIKAFPETAIPSLFSYNGTVKLGYRVCEQWIWRTGGHNVGQATTLTAYYISNQTNAKQQYLAVSGASDEPYVPVMVEFFGNSGPIGKTSVHRVTNITSFLVGEVDEELFELPSFCKT